MFKFTRSFILFFRVSVIFLASATLCRLAFFLFNREYFSNPGFRDFLQGLRFDLVSISYGLLPVFLSLLVPFNHSSRGYLKFVRIYSSLVIVLFTLVNCIDIIYYRFTLKRTTWDIFRYLGAGDDFGSLLPQFLRDYWYMIFIFLLISIVSIWAIRKFIDGYNNYSKDLRMRVLSCILILALVFVGMRGGMQLKPLNIIDASRYTLPQNASLVLSTPFAMMKSMGRNQLELIEYTSEEISLERFNPEQKSQGIDSAIKKNVVVIIMESLSKEYVGFHNNGQGFTPFLDSLMEKSIVFTNAFANGKRSIEALPAIFSGLPNLMTEAHGTSIYAENQLSSLAAILGEHGYYSAFYHGGKNGTMGFDSYINLAGFNDYLGMNEYPNEEDYDGSWGIYDLPYFQYFAQEQGKMKEPFLSSIFSLSAHHPYKLPKEFKEACPKGELQIHPMVCYSDIALRKYFSVIKNEDWYQNTLFVITADHTAQNKSEIYGTPMGIYSIPIVIFDPTRSEGLEIATVCQQSDITPTILSYIGLPYEGVFFGENVLDENSSGFAVSFINNYYQYIDENYCLHYNGKTVTAIYDYHDDPLMRNNLKSMSNKDLDKSLEKLQAIIQQYNLRMIENELTYDGE